LKNGLKQKLRNPPIPKPKNTEADTHKIVIKKVLKQKLRNPPIPKPKDTEAKTYKIEAEIH